MRRRSCLGLGPMRRRLLAPSLAPSKAMMKVLDRLASSYEAPILDAPSGVGRNAFALAARGRDVIALDKDANRLRQLNKFIDASTPCATSGRVFPICADLAANRLPFHGPSFSAIVCIHYPPQRIISDLQELLAHGGHLYIETFQGYGNNYLELPEVGEIQFALQGYEIILYNEGRVGPPSQQAVVVEALARKSEKPSRIQRNGNTVS